MAFMKRIVLFLAVNILVMTTISLILNLLGVQPYLTAYGIDYANLMAFCLVWGMGGAFISLLLSRFMAKMAIPRGTSVQDAGAQFQGITTAEFQAKLSAQAEGLIDKLKAREGYWIG